LKRQGPMLNLLNNVTLKIVDFLLGWILYLPMDVVLIVVSIGTSLILTLARLKTTDQNLLKRCDDDKIRLKALMKEAKKNKDKDAVMRYRGVLSMIAMKSMKQELMPLLVALIPLALLGTWIFQRIEFHPPKAGETVEVNAYFPISAAGQLVHLVPVEGVNAETGLIKEIVPVTNEGPAHGMAAWKVTAKASPIPYKLDIRYKAKTYNSSLLVGQTYYEPALNFYNSDEITCMEVKMKEFKLFNIVPGIPAAMLPAWLVAYLIIVIPFVSILKSLLKIY